MMVVVMMVMQLSPAPPASKRRKRCNCSARPLRLALSRSVSRSEKTAGASATDSPHTPKTAYATPPLRPHKTPKQQKQPSCWPARFSQAALHQPAPPQPAPPPTPAHVAPQLRASRSHKKCCCGAGAVVARGEGSGRGGQKNMLPLSPRQAGVCGPCLPILALPSSHC